MQQSQALQIIESLANGLDPQTGRELPAGTPFEQPQVIRALFAAAGALKIAAQNQPDAAPIPMPLAPPSVPIPNIPRPDIAPIAAPNSAPISPATGAIAASTSWENRPTNAGKAWGREEDLRLCNGFERGVSLDVLAQIHARTLASIQSRLEKLGKIIPEPQSPAST